MKKEPLSKHINDYPAKQKTDPGPPYRTGELFDVQTTSASASSGALFAEQPVARNARKDRR